MLFDTDGSLCCYCENRKGYFSLLQKLATIANPAFYVLCSMFCVFFWSNSAPGGLWCLPTNMLCWVRVSWISLVKVSGKSGHDNEGNIQAEKYQNFSSGAVIYCEFCYRVLQGWLVFVSMDLVPSTKSEWDFSIAFWNICRKSALWQTKVLPSRVLFCAEIITILYTHYKLINPQV